MITINNLVTIVRVLSRRLTVRRDGDGISRTELSITGETMATTGAALTWAQAQEIERLLRELAANPRYRVVHVSSDEVGLDTGLYELLEATTGTQRESRITGLIEVSVTLRRLGGAGVSGANAVRRLRVAATLQPNSWAIPSTPYYALPVGALPLESLDAATRTGRDGTHSLRAGTGGATYLLAGADVNRGEVKAWDTRGDAVEANWQRVFDRDHTFLDPGHCVVDNGLVRFRGLTTGNRGAHTIEVWTGSAWAGVTDGTNGDLTYVGAANVTEAYAGLTIDELAPQRASLRWHGVRGTSTPSTYTKRITLERGKHLALVELLCPTATTLALGLGGRRWTVTRDTARDATVEGGDLALSGAADNWMASWSTLTTTTPLGIVAARSSTLNFRHSATGGPYLSVTSGTSLAAYLGGLAYDAQDAQHEAETGQMDFGAVVGAGVAGASGTGNNIVHLTAANEQVSLPNQTTLPANTGALAWFRVAKSSLVAAGDQLKLGLYNGTVGADANAVTKVGSDLPVAATWYWFAVPYTSSTNAFSIYPYVKRLTRTDGIYYVDQVIYLAINNTANMDRVDDLATMALTEVRVWDEVARLW